MVRRLDDGLARTPCGTAWIRPKNGMVVLYAPDTACYWLGGRLVTPYVVESEGVAMKAAERAHELLS